MDSVIWLITTALDFYVTLVVVQVILSWLVHFNVINARNQFVYIVGDFLHRITDPALKPIRRVMPNLGGLDISPVVLLLLLMFVQRLIVELYYQAA